MKKAVIIFSIILGLASLFLLFGGEEAKQNDSAVGTKEGNIAPQFSVATIDNKTVTSKDVEGKVLVITSSAAWCGTCVMEARQFSPVYKKYIDERVVFLTIDIDPRDSKEFIEQFRKDNDTPWDYADARGAAQFISDYKLSRFEITYIIDRKGIIQYRDSVITSSAKLDEVLERIH